MNKLFTRLGWLGLSLILITSILLAVNRPAKAQSSNDYIESLTADYRLGKTTQNFSTMEVEETITAVFPRHNQKHGILRAIPNTYKDLALQINIQEVSNSTGGSAEYTTSIQNGHLVLKIGDAHRYVDGRQTYRLRYSLQNVISFWDTPDDAHDELYWNINGTQWELPFNKVTARLHVPTSLAAQLQERQTCYSGPQGSDAQDCTITRTVTNSETLITTTTTKPLASRENLSLVVAFNRGTFAPNTQLKVQEGTADKGLPPISSHLILAAGLGSLVPILVILGYIIQHWRKYGRDPQGKGTIIPEYTPPQNLSVLGSDLVLHEAMQAKTISASLIDLAIRKYLAIHEVQTKKFLRTQTDYELELLKLGDDLKPEEQAVIRLVFGSSPTPGQRINLQTLQNKAYKDLPAIQKDLSQNLYEQGYFSSNPQQATQRQQIVGAIIIALGLVIGGGIAAGLPSPWFLLAAPMFGLGLGGLLILVTAKIMPARSLKGVTTRDYLLGLKDYIKLAEADRLKYLQSPEGVRQFGDPSDPTTKVKLFEKLLPYAMLFGLEKDWAKEFQDIYQQPPDWYQGNWNTFSAIYLVNSIGNFSTQGLTNLAPPTSSGSSGFGGGGFSGGGGGGGGGGSW